MAIERTGRALWARLCRRRLEGLRHQGRRYRSLILSGAALVAVILPAASASQEAGRNRVDTEVSPLIVFAQPKEPPRADVQLTVAGDQDAVGAQRMSVWPEGALQARLRGEVVLACEVNRHGLAERCRVAYEQPLGKGFGAAALALRPTFKFDPVQGAEGVTAIRNIAVKFNPPQTRSNLSELLAQSTTTAFNQSASANIGRHEANLQGLFTYGNAQATRRATLMSSPAWVQAPGFEDVDRAYPATGGGDEGYAVAHCRVQPDGSLSHCSIAHETPAGRGFGKAALQLAEQFRISAESLADAPRGPPVEVDVPVRFPRPGESADRTVTAPLWLVGPDAQSVRRVFPAAATANGIVKGEAVVACGVGADGSLVDCTPELARPDGYGFDDAAIRLAAGLKMNLWSGAAGPVHGGTINLRLPLELSDVSP